MNSWKWLCTAICLLFCCTSVAAEPLETEIRTLVDQYNRAFAEGDVASISEFVYAVPSYLFFGSDNLTLNSKDDIKNVFGEMIHSLRSDDYERSDVDIQSVCVLNPTDALLASATAKAQYLEK